MKFIEGLLNSLEKLEPVPTKTKARFSQDSEIRAVVFDIYGTLLISSSGDIEQAEISTHNLKKAFEASNIDLIDKSEKNLEHILHDFEYTIDICHREAKKNNIPFPEIDILSVWEIVLMHARRKNLIVYEDDVNIMRMTCVFEFLSNKVFPMPLMHEVVKSIKEMDLPLGIVSNAQFYTPVLMNYFLGKEVVLDENILHFDPDLIVYSYKLGIGKPDLKLFQELVPILQKKHNLKPEQVLFVGNDMLKDVFASSKVGFKTALFAGDKRSLRLRTEDERVMTVEPDHIITDLKQILEIISK